MFSNFYHLSCEHIFINLTCAPQPPHLPPGNIMYKVHKFVELHSLHVHYILQRYILLSIQFSIDRTSVHTSYFNIKFEFN